MIDDTLLLRRLVGAHYDLVRRADLEELARVRSAQAPVFSLYLDVRPSRRMVEPPLTRFKNLLRQAEQRVRLDEQPPAYRQRWAEDADRLSAWLDAGHPLRGRGLAVLSCRPIKLWRAYRLPVPVRDRLEVADRLYLRPLATLLDEFERYLVVLIDDGTARLIEVYLGTAEEVMQVQDSAAPAVRRLVEKAGKKHDAYLHRRARSVAERAEAYWREQGCDWLMTGGTEEALGELRGGLPKALRERLAGELHLSPQLEPDLVLERVLEIEGEHERRLEQQRLEELIAAAHKGGAGVLGLGPTLLATAERRVRLLVVEEEFAQPGWECPNCQFLGAAQQENCPLCGTALNAQPDVVELALERVLEQDGDVEVLRGLESRRALTRHGRVGALLR